MKRVVITGLGSISGVGLNTAELWQHTINCQSGIAPIRSTDMSDIRFKNGCEVKDYHSEQYFAPKELDVLDRFAQFSLIAAREAVRDAGITWTDELRTRTAVITGTSIGGQNSQEEVFQGLYKEGKARAPLFTIPRIMPNAGASHITMDMGITGMAFTISTACASSNHAIGNAFWMIRNGACEMAITGGSETPLSYGFMKAWEVLRVVAGDTCRPFAHQRQGMVLGEGGAMMVLESLESAKKRGARIYAEIVGFGMSSDAVHITKPDPAGPAGAMRHAMTDAGMDKGKVDYINAHGTGTLINDAVESAAIHEVFNGHVERLAVSSTKALHGHLIGGTSAIEAVITALALKHQVLPPTANFTSPDPDCALDVVPNEAREGKIEYALSNSFAFGGLNAVLAFRRWDG